MKYKFSILFKCFFCFLFVYQFSFAARNQNAKVVDSLQFVATTYQSKWNQVNQKNQFLVKENVFYHNQNKELLEVINNYDNQYFILLIIGFAIVILLALLGILYWREKLRFQNQSDTLNKLNNEFQAIQFGDTKLHEENIELKDSLVSKELELTGLTMQLANIQDSIIKLVDTSIQDQKDTPDISIQLLAKDIRALLSHKDYWAEFMIKFTQIHPNFNANIKIKYPVLTSKDISFCSLIKLNLSNKEIANLLQVSHESVITKKYLLKKKLALTSEQDLYQIINTVE